jgi:hypothetical protein
LLDFPLPEFRLHEPDKLPDGTLFSHTLYCNPNGERVEVHYVNDFAKSEEVAQLFLGEPVLGFDLEWEVRPPASFKDSVSLIQLASPSRIALFHIAKFSGTTPSAVMPPTLAKILESPTVLKCGVAVGGDASRLEKELRLRPRGCFELSHTHNLLSAARNRDGAVPRTLFGLSAMGAKYLGLPLCKDRWVRASAWSRALGAKQKHYAAADAYAGLVLFHELEKQRVSRRVVSPRPGCVDCEGPIVEVKGEEVEDNDLWVDEITDSKTDQPLEPVELAVRVKITRRRLGGDAAAA